MKLPVSRLALLSLVSMTSLVTGCHPGYQGDRLVASQSSDVLQEAEQANAAIKPPPAVAQALIPSAPLDAEGPRLDVVVRGMDAQEFFMGLATMSGQNLLVDPEVSGAITMNLRHVALMDVLVAARDGYGYDFEKTRYGYRISSSSYITRTYNLNYLNLQRQGDTDTRVSSGQVVGASDSGSSGASSSGGDASSAGSSNASQVQTRSQVDLWAEITRVVEALIGRDEGNQVVVNPHASLLVVRASSKDHRAVEAFLEKAELNLQRQVILEAKILEVTLKDGFEAGINWSDMGGDKFGNSRLNLAGDALRGVTGVGGVFGTALTVGDFSGLIQLLESQGRVRVLSSPRISTLNNQKAVIKVGSDEYFVTEVSSSNSVSAGGVAEPTQDVTLTPFFSGISLDVTPQIDQNNEVTLHVRPSVSRVEDQQKLISFGEGRDLSLPLAKSTTRQSDSIVRARNGQVVVIGGLMQNSSDETDAGVPLLSQVPAIGGLFKQQRKGLERTELVILLRPQVIGQQTWLEEVRRTAAEFGGKP